MHAAFSTLTRQPLARAVALLGPLALLAACDSGPTMRPVPNVPFCQQVIPAVEAYMQAAREANPTPDDPRYGGTVVVARGTDLADGMNSSVSSLYASTQHQQFVNLMTLVDYDEDFAPRPYLASSWDVAEDNTSVTFYLRQDVFWHDGEQTDAHDVAFTYEAVTDPATAFPNAAFWDKYVQGPDGVEVIDDFTVRISMEPHAEFLDPFRSVGILPEHLLGDVPHAELKQHPYGSQCPVGNGPFVFYSHEAQNRWVFEANPAFPPPLGGRPFIDRYIYRVVPEQTTMLTELLTGGIDVYTGVAPDQAQTIVDDADLELINFPARMYVFVGWNARRPQLADPRVRRALAMGTDRETIVEAILQGYGTVAHSGVPPFHWAFAEEGVDRIEYDPEGARALLEEAGWIDRDGDGVRENADGLDLEIVLKYNSGNQQRQDIAEIMQSQLADVGVAIRPQIVEMTTLIGQLTDAELRDFDAVVMGWVVEFKLDDTDLFRSDRIDQPYAWSGTDNPEVDRLLEELTNTIDRDDARAIWTEYQDVLMAEQPYLFFYFPDRIIGVNRRLQNVQMDQRGVWQNIREWYVDPDRR